MIALNGEIAPVREVGRARHDAARVDDDIAVHVEHENRSEIARGRGPVEQHVVAQLRRQRADVGTVHAFDDGLQGEFVQLEIALDIPLGEQCEIARCVARAFECIEPALIKHQRAQSDHRERDDGPAKHDDVRRGESRTRWRRRVRTWVGAAIVDGHYLDIPESWLAGFSLLCMVLGQRARTILSLIWLIRVSGARCGGAAQFAIDALVRLAKWLHLFDEHGHAADANRAQAAHFI